MPDIGTCVRCGENLDAYAEGSDRDAKDHCTKCNLSVGLMVRDCDECGEGYYALQGYNIVECWTCGKYTSPYSGSRWGRRET